HAAAWRIACVASRFSPDAELAVIEAFSRLFSALPEEAEEFRTGAVTLRPYVLACARQAALDRAGAAGRADGPGAPAPAPLAGLGPEGEVVLSTLEHHVARGALAALPERSRTALWLFDVEAMTPAEVAGILGGSPPEIAALADSARAEVRATQQSVFGHHEVRAGCRFTVEHLDAYRAGALEPTDGLIVRSHLDRCPPCRMRHGELADAPATLAAAVPAPPLLGGETQQHWLAAAAGIEPAERLLAPAAAAGAGPGTGPVRRLPGVLRRAGRAATRSWRTPGGASGLDRPAVVVGIVHAPAAAGLDVAAGLGRRPRRRRRSRRRAGRNRSRTPARRRRHLGRPRRFPPGGGRPAEAGRLAGGHGRLGGRRLARRDDGRAVADDTGGGLGPRRDGAAGGAGLRLRTAARHRPLRPRRRCGTGARRPG